MVDYMQIELNGAPHQVRANTRLDTLIDSLAMPNQRFAVEINAELVPRSTYAEHVLQDGDQVEIVQAIGGG